ncbi:pyridoxamine 5'-phosphate oxidase family protein [Pseudoponticoccus marisrubri]|uniref:General stress protein n=1 Tax=Pseudoponticoccus marisrubri TaxID=1685382 RepID=A0A0W7WF38_9RHOB|nr:pyridoxamine 5'-phosphate oxidase family protein [Pseudoponticoccus marisrubri]KUF09108.1 general stress protein [Pseudoponticoccus marisrubri]
MSDDLKTEFWSRMDDVRAGMLAADGERPVPMAPMAERDAQAIWFITAAGSAADRSAKSGGEASFHVADPKANFYANVFGKLEEANDSDKLDDLWSSMAAAWFPEGRDDDAVRLVKFTPHDGEVWATQGGAAYLYEIAKANMTDKTPDVGTHGRVVF